MWMLVVWKEIVNRKLIDMSELVNCDLQDVAIANMKQLNAQKRLTTTSYSVIDLEGLLNKNSLKIVEKVLNVE